VSGGWLARGQVGLQLRRLWESAAFCTTSTCSLVSCWACDMQYLVGCCVSLQLPGEGADPGHRLAHLHLAAHRILHPHLQRAVGGDVLANVEETLVGVVHPDYGRGIDWVLHHSQSQVVQIEHRVRRHLSLSLLYNAQVYLTFT